MKPDSMKSLQDMLGDTIVDVSTDSGTKVEIVNEVSKEDLVNKVFGTHVPKSMELTEPEPTREQSILKQFEPQDLTSMVVADKTREGEVITPGRWAVTNENWYTRSNDIADKLATGVYRTVPTMHGLFLVKQKMLADELLELPDDASTEILKHIREFWALQDKFREYGFLHKRGVLLYGPQGSGKTSTVIQTIKAVTDEGGIVIIGDYPKYDMQGIQMFRSLEAERPLVVIFEDVDDTVRYYGDKTLTEMLDGEANVDNVLFLATTNHPERLPARLVNRPSRFDVLKLIGMPSEDARRAYLNAKTEMAPSEIMTWAKKTDGLSISHLKELIILVHVLEKDLDDSIMVLKGMRRIPRSSDFSTEIG